MSTNSSSNKIVLQQQPPPQTAAGVVGRTVANETDSLLPHLRSRRNNSKSPITSYNANINYRNTVAMENITRNSNDDPSSEQESQIPRGDENEHMNVSAGENDERGYQSIDSKYVAQSQKQQQQHRNFFDDDDSTTPSPLLEIPEEIYAVRKAALQVLKPLNKTWVRCCFYRCCLVG
jgi:hypothetical protein